MLAVILLCVLSSIFLSLLLLYYSRILMHKRRFPKFSDVSALPIVGNLFTSLGVNNEDYLKIMMEKFESAPTSPGFSWMGPEIIFGFDKPEDVQILLTSDDLLDKPFFYNYFRMERGLFGLPGKLWKERRRYMNATLSPKMLASHIPIFNQAFKTMADQMESSVNFTAEMQLIMFKATADIALKASFGLDWSIQSERGNEISEGLVGYLGCVQQRIMRFWLKSDIIYNLTELSKMEQSYLRPYRQFLTSVYEAKLVKIEENKAQGFDELADAKEKNTMNFIQKLIQLKYEGKITEDDVKHDIETLFFGNTDTMSITMKTLTLLLAINQDYQDRVVDELREIFENSDDPVTLDDTYKMTFMELVIKELLRLFPAAPLLARYTLNDFQFRDSIIPKGSILGINVLKIHRDPKVWGKDSLEFHPERFLPENFAHIHPYAFLTFSAGPSNCLGHRYAYVMLKISLAYTLRKYKFTTRLRFEDIRLEANVLIKILNEDPVQLERREWKPSQNLL